MKQRSTTLRSQAFTIVELIIVVAVIGILATIGIVSYGAIQANARDKAILSDLDGVAGELAHYAVNNAGVYGSAVEWYSPDGENVNIRFSPSNGNVIDVVANDTDYCIRGYNLAAGQYRSLATAYTKGSSSTACDTLSASSAAIAAGTAAFTDLTWTPQSSPGTHRWSTVAISADGTKQAAGVSNGGYVYTSDDSGSTWTARTSLGSRYWTSIAMSSDGSKLIAAYSTGLPGSYLYRSTDGGVTWSSLASAGQRSSWGVVASSADGTILYAGAGYDPSGSYIQKSTDSGATWSPLTSSLMSGYGWGSGTIDVSSDGSKLVMVQGGNLYVSTDGGATWNLRITATGSIYVVNPTISADGTKLAATVSTSDTTGSIMTSTDSGATWTTQAGAGTHHWHGIASSSNGSRLVAGIDPDASTGGSTHNGQVYTSLDSGVTWTQQSGPSPGNYRAVGISGDGLKLIVGSYYNSLINTGVYTAP